MEIAKLAIGIWTKLGKVFFALFYFSKKISGFTLIEILIVMLIISIVSMVAVTTLSKNQNKELENAAFTIQSQIKLAEEEALLRPATLGFGVAKDKLIFFIYKEGSKSTWQPLKDAVFHSSLKMDFVKIALRVENKYVPLDGEPKIIIFSNGNITPFKLTLEQPQNKRYHIRGRENGIIEIFAGT